MFFEVYKSWRLELIQQSSSHDNWTGKRLPTLSMFVVVVTLKITCASWKNCSGPQRGSDTTEAFYSFVSMNYSTIFTHLTSDYWSRLHSSPVRRCNLWLETKWLQFSELRLILSFQSDHILSELWTKVLKEERSSWHYRSSVVDGQGHGALLEADPGLTGCWRVPWTGCRHSCFYIRSKNGLIHTFSSAPHRWVRQSDCWIRLQTFYTESPHLASEEMFLIATAGVFFH